MKNAVLLCLALGLSWVAGANTIKMNFKDSDVTSVLETYSKATGQKFIVDPIVRGKISILVPQPVSSEEAFSHLSTALAINGYAISTRGDTMVVRTARNTQRDLIEVTTAIPAVKPERMVTWVVSLKHTAAKGVNRDLRILQSKDGEMTYSESTNQLFITDWTPNLNRIGLILKELDKPVDQATQKIIATVKKEEADWRAKNPTPANRDADTLPPPPMGPPKGTFPPPAKETK